MKITVRLAQVIAAGSVLAVGLCGLTGTAVASSGGFPRQRPQMGRAGSRGGSQSGGSPQQSPEVQAFKARQQQKMQQYLQQFDAQNKEFLNTLSGIFGRTEKIESLRSFIRKQYDQNSAFRKTMYEEQRAFVQGRLDANPDAQPMMKERMLSRIDEDYAQLKEFHAGKLREDMAFLDGLLRDQSLDGEALNKALSDFFKSQKTDAQEFLQGQQQKYRGQQR